MGDFRVLLRVRYAECDAQRVVFNARYGDYADVALTEYFRALFGSYENLFEQGYDSQVVRMATDWKSPARCDDVLVLEVATKSIGNTSYTIGVKYSEFFSGRHIADTEITYVLVSAERHEKTPVPDFVRAKLQAGAPGEVVNLAGLKVD